MRGENKISNINRKLEERQEINLQLISIRNFDL